MDFADPTRSQRLCRQDPSGYAAKPNKRDRQLAAPTQPTPAPLTRATRPPERPARKRAPPLGEASCVGIGGGSSAGTSPELLVGVHRRPCRAPPRGAPLDRPQKGLGSDAHGVHGASGAEVDLSEGARSRIDRNPCATTFSLGRRGTDISSLQSGPDPTGRSIDAGASVRGTYGPAADMRGQSQICRSQS